MLDETKVRHFLQSTLQEAEKAFDEGNYPIGSLLVNEQGEVLSLQRNKSWTSHDLTAHAEVLNLREVGKLSFDPNQKLQLFSSLEPCFGCSFFIARSNISHIYSALKDPHKGGTSDLKSREEFKHFFSEIEIINQPFEDLAQKSRQLMKKYFLRQGRVDKAAFYEI